MKVRFGAGLLNLGQSIFVAASKSGGNKQDLTPPACAVVSQTFTKRLHILVKRVTQRTDL
jgi:hypothetical protein